MENNQPVRRDMSDDWNEKLSKIIYEIDMCHQSLSINKPDNMGYINDCYFLKDRIASWYGKLFPKLNDEEKETYINLINQILDLPLTKKSYPQGPSFNWTPKPIIYIQDDNVKKYVRILTEIEIHLNSCMERLQLNNPSKSKGVM